MKLKGQHIERLFTFLAGLIILAHAVVPHHHHFEITHSSDEKSSYLNSKQENSTEKENYHCHALNVLISNGATYFSLNQSSSTYFSFFLPVITTNIELLPVQNINSNFLDYKAIFIKQFFIATHALRGPPAIA